MKPPYRHNYCRRCGNRNIFTPMIEDDLWREISSKVPRCITNNDLLCFACVETILGRQLVETDLLHSRDNKFLLIVLARIKDGTYEGSLA